MNSYNPPPEELQAVFLKDEAEVNAFIGSLSHARMARYIKDCGGNLRQAIDLYYYNAKLSQALYMNIQIWEITLRNRLNAFLCWKYGQAWPHDEARAVRALQRNDKERLKETKSRLKLPKGAKVLPTDAIVADLSAGFWVSLLTKSYDVPFVWRHNLARVFPHQPALTRQSASEICAGLLDLRNRIAHHEPVYHLKLEERRAELKAQIAAMCSANSAYADHACSFETHWKERLGLVAPMAAPNSN